MTRFHHLTVLTLLAGALGLVAPLPVSAADGREPEPGMRLVARGGAGGGEKKDDGKDDGKDGEKKKERTAEQKLLDAVAAEFKAGAYAKLAARMPTGDGKVSLHLNTYRGSFKRAEAKGALEDWFDDRDVVSAKMTSNDGLVGHFAIRVRKHGTDDLKDRTLTLGLRRTTNTDGSETILLVKIEVRGT